MKKDPYYTYTEYRPCKPVAHKVCWVLPVLVLAVATTLVIAVYYGAALLAAFQGGL